MRAIPDEDGFEFVIRTNDHDPPHVHVFKADGEARFLIYEDREPELDKSWMGRRDVKAAKKILSEQRNLVWEKWVEIHG
jgi:hypothetical protein